MATAEEIVDEAKRTRKVPHIVDMSTALTRNWVISHRDAEIFITHVREQILRLFPGNDETYEVIYARHFRRLIGRVHLIVASPSGVSEQRLYRPQDEAVSPQPAILVVLFTGRHT